jgi:hypothetical protein
MLLQWADIAFKLDDDLAAAAAEAWRWLIPEPWHPLLCSMFGGIFLEKEEGGVFWLECGTGEVVQVADSAAAFDAYLAGPRDDAWLAQIDDWFLLPLVEQIHAAGKRPAPGQCYGATILPIFKGGAYNVGNMFVLPAREWLTMTGDMHRQLIDVPDGAQVRITTDPE